VSPPAALVAGTPRREGVPCTTSNQRGKQSTPIDDRPAIQRAVLTRADDGPLYAGAMLASCGPTTPTGPTRAPSAPSATDAAVTARSHTHAHSPCPATARSEAMRSSPAPSAAAENGCPAWRRRPDQWFPTAYHNRFPSGSPRQGRRLGEPPRLTCTKLQRWVDDAGQVRPPAITSTGGWSNAAADPRAQ
jgi:hypothetical protein